MTRRGLQFLYLLAAMSFATFPTSRRTCRCQPAYQRPSTPGWSQGIWTAAPTGLDDCGTKPPDGHGTGGLRRNTPKRAAALSFLFLPGCVSCSEAHNPSRKIRDAISCRSFPARVPRLRPVSSSLLRLVRTPGHLPSLPRPISRFLFGRQFSLANHGRVLLATARRGIDRNGVAQS